MDYKQIALINERKLKNENARLKTLLYNCIIYLESDDYAPDYKNIFDFLEKQIGITKKEYNEIMGE